ncbi:hypothetical protein GQ42DRAFT_158937, partial [Ramicandelaber brevisporus]
LPILREYDPATGEKVFEVAESSVIETYLATKLGLNGKTLQETTLIASVRGAYDDIREDAFSYCMAPNEDAKAKLLEKLKENANNTAVFLDKFIANNPTGSGYFVGDSLTNVDIIAYISYLWSSSTGGHYSVTAEKTPHLLKLIEKNSVPIPSSTGPSTAAIVYLYDQTYWRGNSAAFYFDLPSSGCVKTGVPFEWMNKTLSAKWTSNYVGSVNFKFGQVSGWSMPFEAQEYPFDFTLINRDRAPLVEISVCKLPKRPSPTGSCAYNSGSNNRNSTAYYNSILDWNLAATASATV